MKATEIAFGIHPIFKLEIISEQWVAKMTSIHTKWLLEHGGDSNINKVYVKIIDNFYGIVTSRRS